jgi:hypothetical protein
MNVLCVHIEECSIYTGHDGSTTRGQKRRCKRKRNRSMHIAYGWGDHDQDCRRSFEERSRSIHLANWQERRPLLRSIFSCILRLRRRLTRNMSRSYINAESGLCAAMNTYPRLEVIKLLNFISVSHMVVPIDSSTL